MHPVTIRIESLKKFQSCALICVDSKELVLNFLNHRNILLTREQLDNRDPLKQRMNFYRGGRLQIANVKIFHVSNFNALFVVGLG